MRNSNPTGGDLKVFILTSLGMSQPMIVQSKSTQPRSDQL